MEEQTSLQQPEHQMSLSESVVANILSKMSTQIEEAKEQYIGEVKEDEVIKD